MESVINFEPISFSQFKRLFVFKNSNGTIFSIRAYINDSDYEQLIVNALNSNSKTLKLTNNIAGVESDIFTFDQYLDLGNVGGSSDKDAIINAYNAMVAKVTGKTVYGTFNKTGIWSFMGYSYPSENGNYGGLLAMRYDGPLYQLSNVNGTYSVFNISKTTI